MRSLLFSFFLMFSLSGCSHMIFVPLVFEPKENTMKHKEAVLEVNQLLLPMLTEAFAKGGWKKLAYRSQRIVGKWKKKNTTIELWLYSPLHPSYHVIHFNGDQKLIDHTLATLQKTMKTWDKRYQKIRVFYKFPWDFKGFRAISSLYSVGRLKR